jgi:hypothetical protein
LRSSARLAREPCHRAESARCAIAPRAIRGGDRRAAIRPRRAELLLCVPQMKHSIEPPDPAGARQRNLGRARRAVE